MALVKTKQFDSDRRVIMNVSFSRAANEANPSNEVIIDVSSLRKNDNGDPCTSLRVRKIKGNVTPSSNADHNIRLKTSAGHVFWGSNQESNLDANFCKQGGLPDTTSYDTTSNGDIQLDLVGSTRTTGDTFNITLECAKKYA